MCVSIRNHVGYLFDSFEWEKMVNKFKMQPVDAIVADALSPDDRNDAEIVALAFDAKECPGLHIEGGENGRSAKAYILGNADLTRRDVTVFVEHLEKK